MITTLSVNIFIKLKNNEQRMIALRLLLQTIPTAIIRSLL